MPLNSRQTDAGMWVGFAVALISAALALLVGRGPSVQQGALVHAGI
jgi:hypothetical protein